MHPSAREMHNTRCVYRIPVIYVCTIFAMRFVFVYRGFGRVHFDCLRYHNVTIIGSSLYTSLVKGRHNIMCRSSNIYIIKYYTAVSLRVYGRHIMYVKWQWHRFVSSSMSRNAKTKIVSNNKKKNHNLKYVCVWDTWTC